MTDKYFQSWISIDEQLPEERVDVLCAWISINADMHVVAFFNEEGKHVWYREEEYGWVEPTHWMPLPPLPIKS